MLGTEAFLGQRLAGARSSGNDNEIFRQAHGQFAHQAADGEHFAHGDGVDPDTRRRRELQERPEEPLAQAFAEASAGDTTQQPPGRAEEELQKERGIIKNANECDGHALPVDALRPT